MNKINIVAFQEGETSKTVHNGLWQWDYGQTLRIQGLSLPSAVEIHFSLQENGGEAKRRIGLTKSGVTDVVIPDFILEGNNPASGHYNAFAFIYPSDEESGETTHKIILRIKTRPRPEGTVPSDETTFGAIMEAVREIAARTGGEVPDEKIETAVKEYLIDNPPSNVSKTSELENDSDFQTGEQVRAEIGKMTHFRFEKADILPEFGDANVIYLVPGKDENENLYLEYIYVDSKYEKIGNTDIDLSNVYEKDYIDEKFNQLSEQKVDKMTDEETIEMLIEADLLPTVTTTSGAILTDNNGNVILRY